MGPPDTRSTIIAEVRHRIAELACGPQPLDSTGRWQMASLQNELGQKLLRHFPNGRERIDLKESVSEFKEAVEAHREALRWVSAEDAPLIWARARRYLGHALAELAVLADSEHITIGLLVESVTAYRLALTVFSPESTPQEWAATQTDQAISWQWLACCQTLKRDEVKKSWSGAAAAYEASLLVYQDDNAAGYRNCSLVNLGAVLSELGAYERSLSKRRKTWEAALDCLEAARTSRERHQHPDPHQHIPRNLRKVRRQLRWAV